MKIKRLKSMTADEIAFRLRERLYREVDRLKFHLGIGVEEDAEFSSLLRDHGSVFKRYLQDGPASRFYASLQPANRFRVGEIIRSSFPSWIARALEHGDTLCERRVDILAFGNVALGTEIDWHRDPITGFRWPRRYCAGYDLLRTGPDAKVIHELNRHQHLPRLAKAFFITGDERYACEAVAQMENWIDQNAKWDGVNWQSSLEIAIRCISWMWSVFMLLPSKALDERAARRICKSLFGQLDHVCRYPSVYSSPNTHLIGEAAAVFMGGLLFPELPRALKWRQFGAATLVREMERQVLKDGVYCELSTYYHCYAADFYLQAMLLARLNRFAFPDWMWHRLMQMFEFVVHLTRSDGSIPLIGDDDGGRVLALHTQDYRSFADGLSSAAVLFGRPDFKYQSGGFAEESLWLLGHEARHIFDSLEAQPPSKMRQFLLESGYFIQRSGWESGDSHIVFDCGGLGRPGGGHGHADALSVTLFSGGRELLIDPGTSVYNGAPEWRNFFRSTRAHNTVVVDGSDQSEPGATFGWKRKSEARLVGQFAVAGIEYVDGEHDGYAWKGITHRRRLVYIRPSYWIVLDELLGCGEHDFQFFYNFAPDAELLVFGDEGRGEVDCRARISASDTKPDSGESGLHLFMYGSTSVQAEAICAQLHPHQGWCAERYGERKPSPLLRATMRAYAPAAMMSFLMPGQEPRRSRRLEARGNPAVSAVVRDGDYEDISVLAAGGNELQLVDYAMRGDFFWIRTQNGSPKQVLAVNAQSFRAAGEVIFESPEPISYVLAYFWDNGIVIERGGHEGNIYVRDLRDRQFQRY